MQVKIKRLNDKAILPTKAHATDAGYDLYAASSSVDKDYNIVYGTGVAVEIPTGYVGLVFPRSSIASKDIMLSNSVGVIDSGYRGEVMTKFKRVTGEFDSYQVGDRIAQLIIIPYPEVTFVEVDELSDSDRGVGGYGSTGK
jgi:dUTP pyrophosphatase